jgi:hypothetical protein
LKYEDIDGRAYSYTLEMAFDGMSPPWKLLTRDLRTYPQQYSLLCFSDDNLPKRSARTFTRFTEIFDMDIKEVVIALVMSLQGDDEIDGGASRMLIDAQGSASEEDGEENEWEGEEPESQDYMPMPMTSGSPTARGGMDWDLLNT